MTLQFWAGVSFSVSCQVAQSVSAISWKYPCFECGTRWELCSYSLPLVQGLSV